MTRKGPQDWYWACTRVLLRDGALKITLEALCHEIGLTKGSFYHHFSGMDAFISGFLDFFEAEGTLNIIELVNQESNPQTRLSRLLEIAIDYPPELAVSMRAWAHHDERVRAVMARVDQRRLDYLFSLWRSLTGDETMALTHAQATYALLVGGEHLFPPLSKENFRAVFAAYLEAHLP